MKYRSMKWIGISLLCLMGSVAAMASFSHTPSTQVIAQHVQVHEEIVPYQVGYVPIDITGQALEPFDSTDVTKGYVLRDTTKGYYSRKEGEDHFLVNPTNVYQEQYILYRLEGEHATHEQPRRVYHYIDSEGKVIWSSLIWLIANDQYVTVTPFWTLPKEGFPDSSPEKWMHHQVIPRNESPSLQMDETLFVYQDVLLGNPVQKTPEEQRLYQQERQQRLAKIQQEEVSRVRVQTTPPQQPNAPQAIQDEIERQKQLRLEEYIFQWGDTLENVAIASYQTVEHLAYVNGLDVTANVEPGTTLKGVITPLR